MGILIFPEAGEALDGMKDGMGCVGVFWGRDDGSVLAGRVRML